MKKLHKVHCASNRRKVVGVSLSKPQTIVEELHCTCVCMLACLLACTYNSEYQCVALSE